MGHAQSTSGALDSAAVALSALTFGNSAAPGIPKGTSLLLITASAAGVRWRDDGIAPTASVGYPLAMGGELRYTSGSAQDLKVIGQLSGAVVNVIAYGSI